VSKSLKIGLSLAFEALWFRNEATYLKSKARMSFGSTCTDD